MAETELGMVERHIAMGDRNIARQREIIQELTEGGHPTADAIDLLTTYEQVQVEHIAHRDRLLTLN